MAVRRPIETVLVVDDDDMLVRAFESYLRGLGKTVFTASDAKTAMQIARKERPHLAIVDMNMPGSISGIALIGQLKRDRPTIYIAMISGYATVLTTVAAMHAGAEVILPKPITAKEVMRVIDDGLPPFDPGEHTPSMKRAQYEHVARVLADCNNNISQAAKRLGVSRTTLQRIRRKPAPKR
jgi:two-component system response regulator RegA